MRAPVCGENFWRKERNKRIRNDEQKVVKGI
jgi:hypothetical protein